MGHIHTRHCDVCHRKVPVREIVRKVDPICNTKQFLNELLCFMVQSKTHLPPKQVFLCDDCWCDIIRLVKHFCEEVRRGNTLSSLVFEETKVIIEKKTILWEN